MVFRDRRHAGAVLARHLGRFGGRDDVVVIGLPRGGVPVAAEVARALGAPLDVLVVRKIGAPDDEEVALGAIATGGFVVVNHGVAAWADDGAVRAIVARELLELARREDEYRAGRSPLDVKDKVVIVVDDGLATGASMKVALQALRTQGPRSVIVAVPVGAKDSLEDVSVYADDVVCVDARDDFTSVGRSYDDFSATDDDEVQALLGGASP